ncbi:MAG: hypothetical protein OXU61_12445, partial [Gammaproteobacteria bacterium]|nr:hypothetical protein [Gammaproteobacteria bacterium]
MTTRTYTITDDDMAEPDETITFALPTLELRATPDTYTTTSTDITITIRASDQPVFSVAVDDADLDEGDTAIFTVTLGDTAPVSGTPATVNWAVSGDVAAADYTVSGDDTDGMLSFTALESQALTFAIADDSVEEDAESLTFTLSNPGGGSVIATAAAIATIAASDQPVVRTLTLSAVGDAAGFTNGDRDATAPGLQVDEGDRVSFTLAIDGVSSGVVTFNLPVLSGTATAADLSSSSIALFPLSSGVLSDTRSIDIVNDSIAEPDETVIISVTIDSQTTTDTITPAESLTFTIRASDQPTFSVAADDAATSEGDTATFTVTLGDNAPASGTPATVDWAVSGDVAAADYMLGGADTDGTLAFTALGSQTVTLAIAADNLNEAAETLSFTLSNPGGGSIISTAAAAAAIAASDPIAVGIARAGGAPATVNEGQTARFAVTLSGASAGSAAAITVPYTVAGSGTYNVASGDRSGSLTIPAGDTSGVIALALPNDPALGMSAADQTLTVTLGAAPTAASGGGVVARSSTVSEQSAAVMVNFVDAAHTFAFSSPPATIAEGASAEFTVARTGSASLGTAVQIMWAVSDAASGNDVSAADFGGGDFPSGSLMFSGGDTVQRFAVTPADDNLSEAGETFAITLSASDAVLASNGQIALGSPATVIITDGDEIRVALTGPATVREQATAEYRVSLSAAPTGATPVTLSWAVAAGMASGATIAARTGDFAGNAFPAGTLTFAAGGALAQSITFTTSAGVAGPDGGTDNTPDR